MKLICNIFLTVFFSLIALSSLYSKDISLEMSPNPVGRGDRFKINIFVDHDDMTGISIVAPELPNGIRLYKGPYKRPYWLKLSNGGSKKKILYTYTYSTNKVGRFAIRPFKVSIGDDIYLTEPTIIRVGLYKRGKLYLPYNVEWSLGSEKNYYEGQAIPLVLYVKDLEEVMLFDKVSVSSPDKGFMEPATKLGRVEVSKIGEYTLYNIPVKGEIFTPSSAGRMKIPRGTVSARGISSVSGPTFINVLKIPKQIKSTGAIGNFRSSSWLKQSKLSINEKIELHVKIEGTGNLNYFQLQPPSGDSLTLVDTTEVSDYIPSDKGFTGSRETVYSFISNSKGKKSLIIPSFPFLEPGSNNVIAGSPHTIPVEVTQDVDSLINKNAAKNFPFSPKKIDSGEFASTGRYKEASSYLWLLPGPLIFLIFFLTGKKKIIIGASIVFIAASGHVINDSTIDIAIDQYENSEYSKAIDSFNEVRDKLHDNSYISYNLALAYYQLGDYGKSIYEARNAFYHDPLNPDYRKLVNYIENKSGIIYPVELSFKLYPDAFLFLLMITINLAAFIGVIYLVKNRNIYLIISVLLLSLSVLAAGGLGYSVIQKGRLVGVIIQNKISVKKIPLQKSETLVEMKSGDSVLVKGSSANYLFINTGTGIKGWIDKSKLLLLKD